MSLWEKEVIEKKTINSFVKSNKKWKLKVKKGIMPNMKRFWKVDDEVLEF